MLNVARQHSTVRNHLYDVDQFLGLVGSLGPSHVTTFWSSSFLVSWPSSNTDAESACATGKTMSTCSEVINEDWSFPSVPGERRDAICQITGPSSEHFADIAVKSQSVCAGPF